LSKVFWLQEAERYLADCRRRVTSAGIGYFYLRLYDSAAVPSILLVNS
jgi:hypothetical protein